MQKYLIRSTKQLGETLKQARKKADLTQVELAKKAKVSRSWLSQLESGKFTAELGKVMSVIESLDLAIDLVTYQPTDSDKLLDSIISNSVEKS